MTPREFRAKSAVWFHGMWLDIGAEGRIASRLEAFRSAREAERFEQFGNGLFASLRSRHPTGEPMNALIMALVSELAMAERRIKKLEASASQQHLLDALDLAAYAGAIGSATWTGSEVVDAIAHRQDLPLPMPGESVAYCARKLAERCEEFRERVLSK